MNHKQYRLKLITITPLLYVSDCLGDIPNFDTSYYALKFASKKTAKKYQETLSKYPLEIETF